MEAVSHLTKGLELLKSLPDTVERIQQELTLQITLGVPLMATKGYAAPEVEIAYMRARQLLTQVYGWFTEGFDTADLQEAKALLEVLD